MDILRSERLLRRLKILDSDKYRLVCGWVEDGYPPCFPHWDTQSKIQIIFSVVFVPHLGSKVLCLQCL